MNFFKKNIIEQIETSGGCHDEMNVYGGELGDLGLCGGPGSIS
jgi:hypothetical protein